MALLTGVAIAAIGTPAYAQDKPADTTEGGLVEITVTANKRSENLQQTPVAISAIPSEQLELRQLNEVKDLGSIAPNVAVNGGTTNATAAVITIRGIPTAADETQGYDSPIGVYLDGVYLARSSAASFDVADIERVEVLRGPQGTLFGRNTTGGAVNFVTKAPENELGVRVKAGLGNFGMWQVKGTLETGTIGDVMRMSITGMHKQRNGTVNNLLQPKDSLDPGGYKIDGFRIAAELDLADNIKLTNIFDWTRIKGVPPANQLSAVGNGTFRPNVTFGTAQVAQVQPANVAAYLATASVLQTQCGTPLSSVSLTRLDSMCLDQAGLSTDKIWGNLTRIEADMGGVKLRSSTALRRWRNKIEGSDLDGLGTLRGPVLTSATTLNGMPLATLEMLFGVGSPTAAFLAGSSVPNGNMSLFQANNDREQDQFSQEFELVSDTDGDFQWVIGAFYFKESGREVNPQNFAFILDTNDQGPLGVFNPTNFGGLAPLLVAGNPVRYRASVQSSTLGYTAGGDSKALYAQGTYRPGGKDGALGITLGLRYTWDHKWVKRFQNGTTAYTNPTDIALNSREVNFSAPTGNLSIDYRASEDVNLYARIARGYRSGGYNLRQSTQKDNPATLLIDETVPLLPFNEEKIWSYEVGAKMEFARRFRLNMAFFYNKYSDLQATIPIPISGGGSFGTQVVNAGAIDYIGFEVEAMAKVNDIITLDGSVGYTHKNVKQFPGTDTLGNTINIASVITPGNSPDWTASAGVNVKVPMGSADGTFRLGWSYVSEQVMFGNPMTAPFQAETAAGSRSLLDAQFRIDGISIGGVKAGLTIWGKNLTDKEYVSRGVDFGQLGFGSVIYGDPRTFGATLDLNF
ncbi:TonB-dependent receptor [Novosphingobium sp.]|uniref:TonB-dependent receptor n=1 Tax=Novosphingobium sp. TaxID=1874826 RepID=UPI0025EBD5CC|nr:TonB-dependent receptor [Novosphingobium sp.]MCC6924701.1 TonB-dependent receptor [Novosphingobium sp.]